MKGCLMNVHSRCWLHVEHSASFSFDAEKPIKVESIHVRLTLKTGNEEGIMQRGGGEAKVSEMKCVLWAKCVPTITVADKLFCDQPPFIVASFLLGPEGVATATSLSWEIGENVSVSICLTGLTETPEFFSTPCEEPLLCPTNMNNTMEPIKEANTSPHLELESIYNVTLTFAGVKADWGFQQSIWQPLLCFRWFELQGHIREATVPSLPLERRGKKLNDTRTKKRRMITGDIKEASAVSSCGNYVLWRDGTLGLRQELVPYHRVYTPANAEKRVRVRRFPHRFADIVGEIPFGSSVEAIGRQVDGYTNETYVLVILLGAPDAATVAETYNLQCIEPNKWIWGWSKISSRSGLLLLVEVTDTAGSSLPDYGHVERLGEPTYYTSVREERSVRIRSGPSLSTDVVKHLEPNEVKVAVAIHHFTSINDDSSVRLLQQFVEWEEGGFSLLRNNDRVYLVPVHLQQLPRHFPVCPRPATNSPEIIPLHRKRCRTVSPANNRKRPDAGTTLPPDLWSPADIPETLAAGLMKGSVRLEELPKINLNGSPTHSSPSSNS
ncbi:hypothetical protein TCDM_01946 [Trypanosoma cruzi Dm28c]|uniref:Uncharacterized protein n=2 Tax=Trypanosoma cruzi TaxID=5693 RepID=V5BSP9_TRYCR|nr:hypothetical protein TCDM_01946 [Trypanosoma cruzi Dm28c]